MFSFKPSLHTPQSIPPASCFTCVYLHTHTTMILMPFFFTPFCHHHHTHQFGTPLPRVHHYHTTCVTLLISRTFCTPRSYATAVTCCGSFSRYLGPPHTTCLLPARYLIFLTQILVLSHSPQHHYHVTALHCFHCHHLIPCIHSFYLLLHFKLPFCFCHSAV